MRHMLLFITTCATKMLRDPFKTERHAIVAILICGHIKRIKIGRPVPSLRDQEPVTGWEGMEKMGQKHQPWADTVLKLSK